MNHLLAPSGYLCIRGPPQLTQACYYVCDCASSWCQNFLPSANSSICQHHPRRPKSPICCFNPYLRASSCFQLRNRDSYLLAQLYYSCREACAAASAYRRPSWFYQARMRRTSAQWGEAAELISFIPISQFDSACLFTWTWLRASWIPPCLRYWYLLGNFCSWWPCCQPEAYLCGIVVLCSPTRGLPRFEEMVNLEDFVAHHAPHDRPDWGLSSILFIC